MIRARGPDRFGKESRRDWKLDIARAAKSLGFAPRDWWKIGASTVRLGINMCVHSQLPALVSVRRSSLKTKSPVELSGSLGSVSREHNVFHPRANRVRSSRL